MPQASVERNRLDRAQLEQQGHARNYARANRYMFRLVALQALVGLIITVALWFLVSVPYGTAAFAGSVIAVVPSGWFAWRIARLDSELDVEDRMRSIYVGETLKIAFAVSLFVVAIATIRINFLVALSTYAAVSGVYWGALIALPRSSV